MDECDVKVVLLGQSNVGKTSIVHYLIGKKFEPNVSPTLGASYLSKTILVNNINVSLQIWDTAGQERFKVLTPMYYKGAHAAILVYSITDKNTFDEINYWVQSLKDNADGVTKLFLVGNKFDLNLERKISELNGKEKAEEIKADFFETSAFNGYGIDDLFNTIAKEYLEMNSFQQNQSIEQNSKPLNVINIEQTNQKKCC